MAVGWAALTAASKHPANLLPAASPAMAWGAVESSSEMYRGCVPPQPECGPAASALLSLLPLLIVLQRSPTALGCALLR